ncbi:MAG: PEP-CTERM sorting domain-containing protein [Sedimentisphaerales bacterium]|jgi:hypothetical protein
MRKFILIVFIVLAAVSVSANAALFRFHDYSSDENVWLTVDDILVTGNGSYGSGTISNFLIDPAYGYLGVGERIKFDYQLTSSVAGIVYAQLWGTLQGDEPGLISDEFLLWATDTSGLYHVDFISYDSANGVMASEHSGLTLPDPPTTTLTELPEWQLVGSISAVNDTFEVMSIPEPATLILLGLGGLALLKRKR